MDRETKLKNYFLQLMSLKILTYICDIFVIFLSELSEWNRKYQH